MWARASESKTQLREAEMLLWDPVNLASERVLGEAGTPVGLTKPSEA